MNKYYSLVQNGTEANLYIFGDITSWEWLDSDVSSYTLAAELERLEAEVINVHINSYGGEVAEGWAIYNLLKNHGATVRTFCDGFACSIASVIFMAGDERIMNNTSLLFVHNVWTVAAGNAAQLRKTADELEVMSQISANAYKVGLSISDEELMELLAAETWITPEQALEMGFATAVSSTVTVNKATQSARKIAFDLLQNGLIGAETIKAYVASQLKATVPPAEPAPNKTKQLVLALLGGKDRT